MASETLHQILVTRDNYTEEEARQEIKEMKIRVMNGEDPEEILYELGLEPDYVFELIY
jgi:plastocyanin domain-containing protein